MKERIKNNICLCVEAYQLKNIKKMSCRNFLGIEEQQESSRVSNHDQNEKFHQSTEILFVLYSGSRGYTLFKKFNT